MYRDMKINVQGLPRRSQRLIWVGTSGYTLVGNINLHIDHHSQEIKPFDTILLHWLIYNDLDS